MEKAYIEELKEFLRIPSVSTDPARAGDVRKAAHWVAAKLKAAGADGVEVMETAGHPVVYGEKRVGKHLPTVLVYGHYDVQPEDPVEKWTTPPFEPTERDGKIYARGATDDKGQMYIHIKALQEMVQRNEVSCNLKFLIEGEEEKGSPSLPAFCREHREMLKADIGLISDTPLLAKGVPAIEVGLRGLVYFQVDVYGAQSDLHSGLYGGAVPNPLTALSKMLASLHDAKGRIVVPGLYKDVATVSKADRKRLNAVPFKEAAYKRHLGLKELSGEAGFTTVERTTIRPALDINGLWGGFTGEGSKTVLPSEAHAKVSIRLVPYQDPEKISRLFQKHIRAIAPKGVRVEVRQLDGVGKPYVMPTDHIGFKAAEAALKETFRKTPFPTRSGGSIPIVPMFEEILGFKSVLLGFGLPTDNLHAPDEHFHIENFFKGVETVPRFLSHFAQLFAKRN